MGVCDVLSRTFVDGELMESSKPIYRRSPAHRAAPSIELACGRPNLWMKWVTPQHPPRNVYAAPAPQATGFRKSATCPVRKSLGQLRSGDHNPHTNCTDQYIDSRNRWLWTNGGVRRRLIAGAYFLYS